MHGWRFTQGGKITKIVTVQSIFICTQDVLFWGHEENYATFKGRRPPQRLTQGYCVHSLYDTRISGIDIIYFLICIYIHICIYIYIV